MIALNRGCLRQSRKDPMSKTFELLLFYRAYGSDHVVTHESDILSIRQVLSDAEQHFVKESKVDAAQA